jgi:hypothetical protein
MSNPAAPPPAEGPRLLLKTLGGVCLIEESATGRRVIPLRPKLLSILVFLSGERGRTASRQRLRDVIWGEEPLAGSGRQELSELKRQAPSAISTDRRSVTLCRDVVVDWQELQRDIELARADRLSSLYDGPFLDGLDASNSEGFRTFADTHRAWIRRLFIDAAHMALDGKWRGVPGHELEALAERALAIEPADQRSARWLIAARHRERNLPAASLRISQLLTSLDEYGIDPDAETRLLIRRVAELRHAGPVPPERPVLHDVGNAPIPNAPPPRRRMLRSYRRAALLTAAVVVAGALLARRLPARDDQVDATLVLLTLDGSMPSGAGRFDIRLDEIGKNRRAPTPLTLVSTSEVPFSAGRRNLRRSPDARAWLFDSTVAENGTANPELFVVRTGGLPQRLTNAPSDDFWGDWSPDGNSVVFTTKREDPTAMANSLAVLDLETNQLHFVTHQVGYVISPKWSLDGRRIGFIRADLNAGVSEVCTIPTIGGEAECFGKGAFPFARFDAWLGQNDFIVESATDGFVKLLKGQTRTKEITEIESLPARLGSIAVSPDGRIAVCWCRDSANNGFAWTIVATQGTRAKQRLTFDVKAEIVAGAQPLLLGSRRPRSEIARIAVDSPDTTVAVGVAYPLGVLAIDVRGRPLQPATVDVRWSVSDSAIASVDAAGVVMPHAPGRVVVTAIGAGGARDSVTLSVRAAMPAVVFAEGWRDDAMPAWRLYGRPHPRVVHGPSGRRSFLNGGDNSYRSGAYTIHGFPSAGGFGLEFTLSTPITRDIYQSILVLVSPWDSTSLARWDSVRDIQPPPAERDAAGGCAFVISGARQGRERINVEIVGEIQRLVTAPADIRSGKRHRVVLQLFPEGRCGVAIGGRVVGESPARIPTNKPLRVFIEGQSVGTSLLVDSLTAWQGIRTDIDWKR